MAVLLEGEFLDLGEVGLGLFLKPKKGGGRAVMLEPVAKFANAPERCSPLVDQVGFGPLLGLLLLG